MEVLLNFLDPLPHIFLGVTRLAFEVGEGELRGFIRGEEDGKRRKEGKKLMLSSRQQNSPLCLIPGE